MIKKVTINNIPLRGNYINHINKIVKDIVISEDMKLYSKNDNIVQMKRGDKRISTLKRDYLYTKKLTKSQLENWLSMLKNNNLIVELSLENASFADMSRKEKEK